MHFANQIDIQSMNGIAALALLLIVSFAIDRVVTGILFARFVIPPLARALPELAGIEEPDRRRHVAKRLKLSYYVLTIIFATAVVAGPELFQDGDGEFGTEGGIRIVQPLLAQSLTEFVSVEEQMEAKEKAAAGRTKGRAADGEGGAAPEPGAPPESGATPAPGALAGAEPGDDPPAETGDANAGQQVKGRTEHGELIDKVVSTQVAPWLDMIITIIVLVGGADRIAAFAKLPGSIRGDEEENRAPRPVEVTGRFSMEPGDEAVVKRAGAATRKKT